MDQSVRFDAIMSRQFSAGFNTPFSGLKLRRGAKVEIEDHGEDREPGRKRYTIHYSGAKFADVDWSLWKEKNPAKANEKANIANLKPP